MQIGLGKKTRTEEPNRNRTEVPETGTGLRPSNIRTVSIFIYPNQTENKPRTKRVPRYITLLIIYTYKIAKYIFII